VTAGINKLKDPVVREEYERLARRLAEAQRDFIAFIDSVEGLELEEQGLIGELIDVWNFFGVFFADRYKEARLSGKEPQEAWNHVLGMLSFEARLLFMIMLSARERARRKLGLDSPPGEAGGEG
jgi:hypothetical protein